MRSLPATLAITAILVIGLTGCVPQGPPERTPEPSTSQPTEQPAPAATDEPADGYQSTPVTIECSALVDPQTVYDYNPNYSLQPSFTPAAGTDVATIMANQGVGCSWVNQTSGETFVVAVAQLADGDLASIKKGLSTSSSPVTGVGDSAFFSRIRRRWRCRSLLRPVLVGRNLGGLLRDRGGEAADRGRALGPGPLT